MNCPQGYSFFVDVEFRVLRAASHQSNDFDPYLKVFGDLVQDSLGSLQFLFALEDEFGCELPPEIFEPMATLTLGELAARILEETER